MSDSVECESVDRCCNKRHSVFLYCIVHIFRLFYMFSDYSSLHQFSII